MRQDKDIVISLYKSGLSFNEIAKKLDISKGTISRWINQENLLSIKAKNILRRQSSSIKNLKLINERRRLELDNLYKNAEVEAREIFYKYKENPLFMAGICLYWGEGDKVSKNGFRISNSDPRIISVFVKFLLDFCRAKRSRIRASLLIYPDLDEKEMKEYWKQRTGLKDSDFTKTIILKRRGKNIKKGNGVCTLNFSDTYTKRKMLVWIDLASKYLLV